MKWCPTVPGRTVNNFVLSFDDKDCSDVSYYVKLSSIVSRVFVYFDLIDEF